MASRILKIELDEETLARAEREGLTCVAISLFDPRAATGKGAIGTMAPAGAEQLMQTIEAAFTSGQPLYIVPQAD